MKIGGGIAVRIMMKLVSLTLCVLGDENGFLIDWYKSMSNAVYDPIEQQKKNKLMFPIMLQLYGEHVIWSMVINFEYVKNVRARQKSKIER